MFLVSSFFFVFLELIVLSAAHCFRISVFDGVSDIVLTDYKVIVGKYFRDINATESDETQTLKIIDVHIPDSYMGLETFYYADIAVLTLDNPIIFRNHIAPACLNINAIYSFDKRLPNDNTLGLVAGFGQIEEHKPSDNLKKFEIPIVNYKKCRAQAPINYRSFLVGDKICAGFTNNKGMVCRGKSKFGI